MTGKRNCPGIEALLEQDAGRGEHSLVHAVNAAFPNGPPKITANWHIAGKHAYTGRLVNTGLGDHGARRQAHSEPPAQPNETATESESWRVLRHDAANHAVVYAANRAGRR
jgi:hypothetical protein